MAPPVWVVGQVLSASDVNNWLVPQCAIKTADQSVTSSVTLVNDTELFVPVLAGASYQFSAFLDYEGGVNGSSDLQWKWVVPAAAALRYHAVFQAPGGGVTVQNTYTGAQVAAASTNGAAALRGVSMNGTAVIAGTAGNLQLQWAQNTSSGTSTIVHAQSYLLVQRIS